VETNNRVLVTDGEQRASLALVRSLGRAGYETYVTATRTPSLAGASRYTVAEARTPDPLADAGGFVAELQRLTSRWRIGTIIPVAEPALLAALQSRADLGSVGLPFPDYQAFRSISDKRAVTEAAPMVGIAVPRQIIVPAREDEDVLAQVEFPVVIKPARSVTGMNGTRFKVGVSYAATADQLHDRLQELPSAAFPVLLQKRVIGPGVGVFLLLRKGKLLAQFAHRRIREKPPSGGVSVYRESIQADPDLVARSKALLDMFHWEGVAMVEYKIEAETGIPYLMEINGRFWGSLQLALDAGVDFPTLLLRSSRGEEIAPSTYRVGVRSRWWWGDIDQLLSSLRRSATDLDLPPDAPSRWQNVFQFLQLWRPGDHNEVLRWHDPAPFVRESIEWFARLIDREPEA
jgi:predicted ATP-grasp superfamily ATP-dependent carboligase